MEMHLVHELPPVSDRDGNIYAASVIGAPARDGQWDGAIELRDRSGQRLVTPVETRQPNLAALVFWSTGLAPAYVEGALTRALAVAAAAQAAAAAEAFGERAAHGLDRGLRFRRPLRRAPAPRRTPAGKRGGTRTRPAQSSPARSR